MFPFRRKTKTVYLKYPTLYPMGELTFAIACSHCKNIRSDKCHDCKCEKKSGFELNPESFKEDKTSEHS